jgi:hypothetical protein
MKYLFIFSLPVIFSIGFYVGSVSQMGKCSVYSCEKQMRDFITVAKDFNGQYIKLKLLDVNSIDPEIVSGP